MHPSTFAVVSRLVGIARSGRRLRTGRTASYYGPLRSTAAPAGGVVRDRRPPIIHMTCERWPLVARMTDRVLQRRFRQHLRNG